jgi:hypothetical protein
MKALSPLSRLGQVVSGSGLAMLLGACATTYEVKINSIAHPEKPVGTSYRIVTKNGQDPRSDLRTQEAVDYVKTALSGRGMYESPNPDKAEVVVEVDYDVEPPRVKFEHTSVPVYARVGGSMRSVVVPVRDASGRINQRSVTVFEPPTVELVGYEERVIPVVVYEKYLRVSARENVPYNEEQPPAQLWSVHASHEDDKNDIRADLPVLASAVVDYIGVTTQKDQTLRLKKDSAEVAFVKRGL